MNLRRTDTIPRVVRFEGTRLGGKSREAERRGKFSRRASFQPDIVIVSPVRSFFPEAGLPFA